jgi:hypothetical protein
VFWGIRNGNIIDIELGHVEAPVLLQVLRFHVNNAMIRRLAGLSPVFSYKTFDVDWLL